MHILFFAGPFCPFFILFTYTLCGYFFFILSMYAILLNFLCSFYIFWKKRSGGYFSFYVRFKWFFWGLFYFFFICFRTPSSNRGWGRISILFIFGILIKVLILIDVDHMRYKCSLLFIRIEVSGECFFKFWIILVWNLNVDFALYIIWPQTFKKHKRLIF